MSGIVSLNNDGSVNVLDAIDVVSMSESPSLSYKRKPNSSKRVPPVIKPFENSSAR